MAPSNSRFTFPNKSERGLTFGSPLDSNREVSSKSDYCFRLPSLPPFRHRRGSRSCSLRFFPRRHLDPVGFGILAAPVSRPEAQLSRSLLDRAVESELRSRYIYLNIGLWLGRRDGRPKAGVGRRRGRRSGRKKRTWSMARSVYMVGRRSAGLSMDDQLCPI